jgi:hypothetical protein
MLSIETYQSQYKDKLSSLSGHTRDIELNTNDNKGDGFTKVKMSTTMSYVSWRLDIEGVLRAKGQWYCVQQTFEEVVVSMLGMLSEKEKFDHPLGIALCNVDHTCKEMIRD